MTDTIFLNNTVFRVLGRQLGVWGFQALELSSRFVLPWLVAGGLVRNTDPTLNTVQTTFRDYGDRITNFRPVRWLKNGYQWVDGKVCHTLGFIDQTLNRLNKVPGYRLLTSYPLFLGNWEYRYKQMKNFLVIGPLWQHTAQPVLKKYLFNHDCTTLAANYVAPYADMALSHWNQEAEHFLRDLHRRTGSATKLLDYISKFSLQGALSAFFGISSSPETIAVRVNSTYHHIFGPIAASTAEVEIMAQNHLAMLSNITIHAIDKVNALNGYAGQLVNVVGGMAYDGYRFGHCLYASGGKDLVPCTQKAYAHLLGDYLAPVGNFINNNMVTPLFNAASNAANECIFTPGLNFVNTNGVIQSVINNVSYFYECGTSGNAGYMNSAPCLEKVQGFGSCALDLGKYGISGTYNATWNFGANCVSFVWEDVIKANASKLVNLAVENPGTTAAIGVAIPVLMLSAFGAKVGYERLMKPGVQHIQVHGVPQQAAAQQQVNVNNPGL